jgi:hypothetical protein
MSVSQANLGTLYLSPYNYIKWTQPGGPFTTVYPQEENSIYNPPQNPIPPGQFFCEATGLWVAGCGHFYDCAHIFMDQDSDTSVLAAVGCCPLCSYIQFIISPYSDISDTNKYPILIS